MHQRAGGESRRFFHFKRAESVGRMRVFTVRSTGKVPPVVTTAASAAVILTYRVPDGPQSMGDHRAARNPRRRQLQLFPSVPTADGGQADRKPRPRAWARPWRALPRGRDHDTN